MVNKGDLVPDASKVTEEDRNKHFPGQKMAFRLDYERRCLL